MEDTEGKPQTAEENPPEGTPPNDTAEVKPESTTEQNENVEEKPASPDEKPESPVEKPEASEEKNTTEVAPEPESETVKELEPQKSKSLTKKEDSRGASRKSVDSRKLSISLEPTSKTFSDVVVEGIPRRSSVRSSKVRMAVGSIISFRKVGAEGGYYDRRVARFMNSYKLYSDNPFHVEKVEKILEEVLVEAMENLRYDSENCSKQAKWACSMIRAKLKEMEFDRYKLITVVTIGEKRSQDLIYTMRFLWDAERDKFACFTHENMHVFGVAICLGIYYE